MTNQKSNMCRWQILSHLCYYIFFFRVHFSSLVTKNIYISLYTYLKISSKMFLYVHFVIQKYSIRNCIRCTSLYVLHYTYKYNLFYITHILICTILYTEIFWWNNFEYMNDMCVSGTCHQFLISFSESFV